MSDDEMDDTGVAAHPRFSERRALVEDWARRRRNRKLLVLGGLRVSVAAACGGDPERLVRY